MSTTASMMPQMNGDDESESAGHSSKDETTHQLQDPEGYLAHVYPSDAEKADDADELKQARDGLGLVRQRLAGHRVVAVWRAGGCVGAGVHADRWRVVRRRWRVAAAVGNPAGGSRAVPGTALDLHRCRRAPSLLSGCQSGVLAARSWPRLTCRGATTVGGLARRVERPAHHQRIPPRRHLSRGRMRLGLGSSAADAARRRTSSSSSDSAARRGLAVRRRRAHPHPAR